MLLFAQTLEREGRERLVDLAPGQRALWLRTLRAELHASLRQAGLPVIHSSEREQVGATFGERLGNACAAAFAQGYAHLVVVGGDCPGLRGAHLLEAAARLESGSGVLGRDLRGGVYLMGVSARGFDPARLAALPYGAPVLATAFQAYLTAQHRAAPIELETLGDVHARADLLREVGHLRAALLQRIARSLRRHARRAARPRALRSVRPGYRRGAATRRGPPACIGATLV